MLLNLKVGESFEFQELGITIKVLEVKSRQVRIDLTYPDGTKVHKTETIERQQAEDGTSTPDPCADQAGDVPQT